jgi:Flp pilus assembly protein CpaB
MTISTGTLRVGILAILAGLVGAYVIQQVLQTEPKVEPAPPAPQVIPQAAADLPEGRVLTMGDIVLVPMTQEQIAKRDVPMNTVMVDPGQIIGRRLRSDLTTGEFFTTTSLYLEYGAPDLSRLLKPGFRAFSLSMSTSAARGFQEGNLVDVMFRTTPRPAKDGLLAIPEMTVTLLQSVEIIHIEYPPPANPNEDTGSGMLDLRRRSGANTEPRSSVTLAVTPDQAKIMQTAMGRGEITLSPYSAADSFAALDNKPLTLEDILGIEPPPQPPVPPLPFITEIYNRGRGSYNAFNPAAIYPFPSPKPFKAGTLPAPNAPAVPAPPMGNP